MTSGGGSREGEEAVVSIHSLMPHHYGPNADFQNTEIFLAQQRIGVVRDCSLVISQYVIQ